MSRVLSVGLVVFASAWAAGAEPLPLIRDLPLTPVYRATSPIVLETKVEPSQIELQLPSFPKKEGLLCIRFEAYLQRPKPAGWNPYLTLKLNGHVLGPYTNLGFARLLKRSERFKTTLGEKAWWGKRNGMPALNVFFGPGGRVLDQRVLDQREEGYWYLLDISDLANVKVVGADERVERAEPNSLVLINSLVQRFLPNHKSFPPLVVKDLTVGYLPPELADRIRRAQLEVYSSVTSGPKLTGPSFELRVASSGGMQLTVAGERYFFKSAFSFVAEPRMKFNTWAPDRFEGESGWKPTVRATKDGRKIKVSARAKAYAVEREIVLDGPRVRVRDTVRNLKNEPVGLVIRNTLALENMPRPDGWRLAGTDRQMQVGGAAANPTVFASQKKSSVGIVAEDNVFRLQLELFRRYNAFDFQTTHFGLAPGKSYTLEWTIYPSKDREYFAFVNRVRRDWHVNYTIEGPFVFDDKVVPGRLAKIYSISPWLDYDHPGTQTREKYAARVRPVLARLRKAQPDGIFMPRLETNLYTMVKSRIPGGEILPGSDRKKGRYGYELSKEQSRVLEKALGPWADSVLRTEDGRLIVDTYYPGHWSTRDQLFNLLLYVRDGNYRYRFFLNQIDFVMDEVGFNGVYIDQFSQEGGFYRKDRFTYDQWDGHTVDLDEQGRIRRKRTDCNLVGATGRAKILKYIFAKGGKVVTNGQSTVRETRGLPVYAFQEMENDPVRPLEYLHEKPPIFYWQARGHLGCPLILGLRPTYTQRYGEEGRKHWAEMIYKGVITALRNGVLYYYYTATIPQKGPGAGSYEALNHFFPFTPVELHEGWLVGQERIILCVSRKVVWPHKQQPRCLLFDLKGRQKKGSFSLKQTSDGWTVNVKLDDWNEIAVLEAP